MSELTASILYFKTNLQEFEILEKKCQRKESKFVEICVELSVVQVNMTSLVRLMRFKYLDRERSEKGFPDVLGLPARITHCSGQQLP